MVDDRPARVGLATSLVVIAGLGVLGYWRISLDEPTSRSGSAWFGMVLLASVLVVLASIAVGRGLPARGSRGGWARLCISAPLLLVSEAFLLSCAFDPQKWVPPRNEAPGLAATIPLMASAITLIDLARACRGVRVSGRGHRPLYGQGSATAAPSRIGRLRRAITNGVLLILGWIVLFFILSFLAEDPAPVILGLALVSLGLTILLCRRLGPVGPRSGWAVTSHAADVHGRAGRFITSHAADIHGGTGLFSLLLCLGGFVVPIAILFLMSLGPKQGLPMGACLTLFGVLQLGAFAFGIVSRDTGTGMAALLISGLFVLGIPAALLSMLMDWLFPGFGELIDTAYEIALWLCPVYLPAASLVLMAIAARRIPPFERRLEAGADPGDTSRTAAGPGASGGAPTVRRLMGIIARIALVLGSIRAFFLLLWGIHGPRLSVVYAALLLPAAVFAAQLRRRIGAAG
jgi:hypothetical protein